MLVACRREREAHAASAVTLQEAKAFGRLDSDDEDALFVSMINAAALDIEDVAQIALIRQTIHARILCPDEGAIALPIWPLADPQSIIVKAGGIERPGVALRPHEWGRIENPGPAGAEIEVSYAAGFGDTPADIPDDLRNAICAQALVYFDQRSDGMAGAALSPHAARVIARYRGVRL